MALDLEALLLLRLLAQCARVPLALHRHLDLHHARLDQRLLQRLRDQIEARTALHRAVENVPAEAADAQAVRVVAHQRLDHYREVVAARKVVPLSVRLTHHQLALPTPIFAALFTLAAAILAGVAGGERV